MTPIAEKQFSKIEKEIQSRIVNSLERCKVRPHSYVKKLQGNPYFRLRVGDYRIILDIKDNQLIILILELGHRKHIYD